MPADEIVSAITAAEAIEPLKTGEQGAATSIWCATSAQLDGMGGVYCEDCDIAEVVPADFRGASGVRPWASDPVLAERLWKKSEEWTGVTLGNRPSARPSSVADRVEQIPPADLGSAP
jgi:hypothetical protein